LAKRIPRTADISGQLIMLGTGTSVGVPTIGCGCEVCRSDDPKNKRLRCAVVLGLPGGNLLIDTPPDLRTELIREGIGVVHAVLYTHEHTDHLFGMDDLRLFPFYLGHPVPVYCEERVEKRIRHCFDYAFTDREETHAGAWPKIEFHRIDTTPFTALGEPIIPIRMHHGPHFDVLGFRIGNIAYCTDTSDLPREHWHLLEGLDTLILGALRHRPHPTHYTLEESVEIARVLNPKRTIFTHMSHELDYATTNAKLPKGMELGYDGLRIPLG